MGTATATDECVEILAREMYVDDTAHRLGVSARVARRAWYVGPADLRLADQTLYRSKARRIAESLEASNIALQLPDGEDDAASPGAIRLTGTPEGLRFDGLVLPEPVRAMLAGLLNSAEDADYEDGAVVERQGDATLWLYNGRTGKWRELNNDTGDPPEVLTFDELTDGGRQPVTRLHSIAEFRTMLGLDVTNGG